jgi:hypothetical protein
LQITSALLYYRKWLYTHAQWKHLSNKLFTNIKGHCGGIYTIKTGMSNIWQLSGGCLWILPRWRQLRQQLVIRSIDGILMEKNIVGDFVSSRKVVGTWYKIWLWWNLNKMVYNATFVLFLRCCNSVHCRASSIRVTLLVVL